MRAWDCIALTEALLLRIAFPAAALVLLVLLAFRETLTLESAPAILSLFVGRLAPPLRSGVGGGGPPTAG
ncbi:hypothetical protein PAI11_37720 [Patulibacter medicamentivorans]|uniref:Uncharacterized protein n=1 Tax=Patulibacter medicamentivorans TaxID=1097667 RepID=H0EA98_9ACTN|nr:hypothetical protein [Patulibacter medicamentivorans]EHN09438.1 hypothetical protein PAI11_37720 [Patulibacter medicamentivorans]